MVELRKKRKNMHISECIISLLKEFFLASLEYYTHNRLNSDTPQVIS